MTKASKLDEAVRYREWLGAVLTFRKGLDGWNGVVTVSFGSFKAELSRCAREQLDEALSVEERQLRNTLKILGVEWDGDEP